MTTPDTRAAQAAGPRWQAKFALLDKAIGNADIETNAMALAFGGGAIGLKHGGQKLTFAENLKLVCWPAFFFGFLWYFFKGMWKKGLVVLGMSLVLGLLIDLLPGPPEGYAFAFLGYSLLIGKMATIDYYRKLKLGFDGWL